MGGEGAAMNEETKTILEAVRDGTLSVDEALIKLKIEPLQDLGYAKVDLQRKMRTGTAEVIYGEGKTPEQIAGIVRAMRYHGQNRILITRIDAEKAGSLKAIMENELAFMAVASTDRRDDGFVREAASNQRGVDIKGKTSDIAYSASPEANADVFIYRTDARIATIGNPPEPDGLGTILVATGGTSDIPVAEEAALTAEFLGNKVNRVYDIGVAGLHRLMPHITDIMEASVIITIAGMEGALASVVGGLADCPVIAVPTSVGYGASFKGISALLAMLNSCASGVSVVNIDNGFGAGFLANRINHMRRKEL